MFYIHHILFNNVLKLKHFYNCFYAQPVNSMWSHNVLTYCAPNVQSDQKVSVHQMTTVQKTRKNILNSFIHLPR
jgi:hypothetical protein